MNPDRLTDAEWERVAPLLPSESGHSGRPYRVDHRLTLEAIRWIRRTGRPWRSLPDRFGNWNSAYRRWQRWERAGILDKVEAALEDAEG